MIYELALHVVRLGICGLRWVSKWRMGVWVGQHMNLAE